MSDIDKYLNKVTCIDALELLADLPDNSIDCIVTSPPYYGLRDYGVDGQIGLEQTPEEYINNLVQVFREARRVLKKEGTLWLNWGDSYWSFKKHVRFYEPMLGAADRKYKMNIELWNHESDGE